MEKYQGFAFSIISLFDQNFLSGNIHGNTIKSTRDRRDMDLFAGNTVYSA